MRQFFRTVSGLLLIPVVTLGAWARPGDRLGVVLATQGKVVFHGHNRPPNIRQAVTLLGAIREGDTIYLPPASQLTFSWMTSGNRYELKGPLEFRVTAQAPETGPKITEMSKQSDREALTATQSLKPGSFGVDMSKFGGNSARNVVLGICTVYVDDDSPPIVDLDMIPQQFETPTLTVRTCDAREGSPWEVGRATLIHGPQRQDQVKISTLRPTVPDLSYYIFLGDKDPQQEKAIRVVRLPDEKLTGLRTLEKTASDLPRKIELYESYVHLHLYVKAEKLLTEMRTEYPNSEIPWDEVDANLKSTRIKNS